MWKALLRKLYFRLSARFHPRMVYRYQRHDGRILQRTRISNMTRIEDSKWLDVEDNVYIGHFNFIDASGGLFIGEGCQISNYVSILTHSSHIAIRLYGAEYMAHKNHIGYVKAPSSIGRYTFIGAHSVLMPGVKLGKGSIVSAYSYVAAGEYPDFAILSGQPARVTGDTRKLDQQWLQEHPELRMLYQAWVDD